MKFARDYCALLDGVTDAGCTAFDTACSENHSEQALELVSKPTRSSIRYMTDGACFVSSGHQRHTLTIMALTVRVCDVILSERGREPV